LQSLGDFFKATLKPIFVTSSAILAIWLVDVPASAASFDFSRHVRPLEKFICADPELSQIDSELGVVYTADLAQDGTFLQAQRSRSSASNRLCGINTAAPANRIRTQHCLNATFFARVAEPTNSAISIQSERPPLRRTDEILAGSADAKTKVGASVGNIAWVRETPSDECSEASYDFPASLVPIQDDSAATDGLNWLSFDRKVSLYYETNPSISGAAQLRPSAFLNATRCNVSLNSVLADAIQADVYGNKRKLLNCEDGANKMRFTTTYKRNICSTVFATAPDVKNESRFITSLELCAPAAASQLTEAVSRRMFESMSMKYLGCCSKDANLRGCYPVPK
jgi:hypothetical protein